MSKQKDFNQGIETGMKISKELLNRESQAMDYVKNKIDELGNSHGRLENAVNHILENQNSKAIEEYYGIVNGLSPKDLEKEECQILLNILSILAFKDEEYNDMQKSYFLNLKKYLQVTEYAPDMEYRLEYIEKIRDLDSQEIIMRSIREFLFLRHFDFSFQMDYEELFEYFSVNDKKVQQLDNMIEITYFLFGENGIVEMYGNHESDEVVEDNHEDFENEIVDTPAGKKYVIKNQEIYWVNINEYLQDISNKDVKIFEFYKCKVLYNYSASQTRITLNEDERMIFDTCELISGGEDYIDFIIECGKRAQVIFVNSILEHPQRLVTSSENRVKILVNNSEIRCPSRDTFHMCGDHSELEIKYCKIILNDIISDTVFTCDNFVIYDSEISSKETDDEDKWSKEWVAVSNEGYIKNCKFKYLKTGMHMKKGKIENSSFLSCKKIFSGFLCRENIEIMKCYFEECTTNAYFQKNCKIYNCLFNKCKKVFDGGTDDIYVQDSYFVDIRENICDMLYNGIFKNCCFRDIVVGEKDNQKFLDSMISVWGNTKFIKCIFENINIQSNYFIECCGKENECHLYMEDCTLKNCTTHRSDEKFVKTILRFDTLMSRIQKRYDKMRVVDVGTIVNTNLENCKKEMGESFFEIPKPASGETYEFSDAFKDIFGFPDNYNNEKSEDYVKRIIKEQEIGFEE